jgi:hypothetical protein
MSSNTSKDNGQGQRLTENDDSTYGRSKSGIFNVVTPRRHISQPHWSKAGHVPRSKGYIPGKNQYIFRLTELLSRSLATL